MDAAMKTLIKDDLLSPKLINRLLVMIALAYALGIAVMRYYISGFTGFYWLGAALLITLTVALCLRYINTYQAILMLLVAAAGGVAFFYAIQQPAGSLITYTGYPLYVEGTIVDEPLFFEDHSVYRLQTEVIETNIGRSVITGTLLVKIYYYGDHEREHYWYGERLRLRGTIVEPQGQRNPGGFDYRFYLRSEGIDALIYPKQAQVESLGFGKTGLFAGSALKLRSAMVSVIDRALPTPSSELLTAILFGQRHRLPERVAENFRRSGTGHLMAVSGLHVGLVAAMILWIWRSLKLQGRLPLLLAIVVVLGYAYLTGMRPSALRAAIMVSTALTALLLDREYDLPSAVAFAALVTLFYNPLLLFSVGFQLSYASTLVLVYAYRPLDHLLGYLRFPRLLIPALAVTIAAQIGVLPLSVYYFQYLPTGALIFNLLMLPLIAFVVGLGLAGALLGLLLPLPGEIVLWAVRPLLELMVFVTGFSSLPGFYVALSPPGIFVIIVYYSLLTLALFIYYQRESLFISKNGLLREISGKRLIVRILISMIALFTLTIIWSGILFPTKKELKVTYIDVGQGASAMIETPCGKVILIDAGGEAAYRGEPGAVGERILLPLLRVENIRKIDLAVITHPHEDHFGGFIPLIETIAVDTMLISPVSGDLVYYIDLLDRAASLGVDIHKVNAGQVWSCGPDMALEFIYPNENLLSGAGDDLNNNSIVCRLRYGAINFLFTGDIEDVAVEDLFRRNEDLKAVVLQVPHHGGYMKAMPALIEAVAPSIAVIQVGTNSFGHPHPYVLDALNRAGVTVYRNDQHGAVIIKTDGSDVQVTNIAQPTLIR
jgi:competence protein ComEC